MDDAPAAPALWRGDGTEQAGLVEGAPDPLALAQRHVRIRGLASPGAEAADAAVRAGVAAISLVAACFDHGPAAVRAAARRLRELDPAARVHLDVSRRVDGEIVTAYGAVPAVLHHRLLLGGPHVALLADEAGVTVLPIRPGATACLRCRDLARADLDPAWPVIAAQCEAHGPPPDPLTTAVAGSLAASSLAVLLAGDEAPAWRVERGLPRIVPAPPHPACGCGATPG
ncbi:hypothetical protein [Demequina gelatinilytica]|uniref:hypothetical protein n=1 Tax=Demequina gelatinilytica TaxID=1638980 RepID=UPI0007830585|nr:hypothetical protein [Demequina gelatinilytica]